MDLSKMIQTGKFQPTGIEGVQLKELKPNPDERGYFQENLRVTDSIFAEGFGQWSETVMYSDVIKAWHVHFHQVDWWRCSQGVIKAVLCDLRDALDGVHLTPGPDYLERAIKEIGDYNYQFEEYILGGLSTPTVLKIPPGVAHGCKVLQGPAMLTYITSKVYNPDDEGRIPYDALGYDWLKGAEIK